MEAAEYAPSARPIVLGPTPYFLTSKMGRKIETTLCASVRTPEKTQAPIIPGFLMRASTKLPEVMAEPGLLLSAGLERLQTNEQEYGRGEQRNRVRQQYAPPRHYQEQIARDDGGDGLSHVRARSMHAQSEAPCGS